MNVNGKILYAAAWVIGFLVACGSDPGQLDETLPEPEPLPNNWCERLEPGGNGTGDTAEPLALSRVHGQVRFFGIEGYRKADRVLLNTLGEDPSVEQILQDYASNLPSVCHAEPTDSTLPEAELKTQNSVAVVRPGRGSVSVDPSVETVVVDLRGLPAGDDTWTALRRAVSPLISDPISRLKRRVRLHQGMVDEVIAPAQGQYNFFKRRVETISKPSIDPSRDTLQQTRIVLRTGRTISPEAAEFAAMLKTSERAHIVGRSIPTAIAESEWVGTEYGGVAFKARDLMKDEENRLVDTISVDQTLAATAEPDWAQWDSILGGLPTDVESAEGARTRKRLAPIRPVSNQPGSATEPGIIRTNLIIMHAAARLFYAYYGSEQSGIDDRLVTLWTRYVPESSNDGDGPVARAEVELAMRRLANEFNEQHAYVLDRAIDETSRWSDVQGYLGIKWEVVSGKPVVRYTLYEQVEPGDRLVEVDGTAVEDLLETWRGLVSSNNEDGEVIAAVNRAKRRMKGPYSAVFETPDGTRKTVTLEPVETSRYQSMPDVDSTRDAGWLSGQDSDIYYVNLDRSADQSNPWSGVPSKLSQASGLIIDMRGYPSSFQQSNVLANLTDESKDWLTYAAPTYRGASARIWDEGTRRIDGRASSDVAELPVAVLVGIDTASAAENIVTPLWMYDIARFFGRPTAGSNGNMTGLWLPGKFAATFTGLKVKLANGESYHDNPIQPDERVAPTASDLASGNDPVLNAARSWIRERQD